MRYAGIALLCAVAAFGAAFLIRRAVDHGAPVTRATVAADTHAVPPGPRPAATRHTRNAALAHPGRAPRLAAEFAPGVQRITRKRPQPRHRHHRALPQSSGAAAPTETTSTPTYATSTPTYPTSTPTYTPPATQSAPTAGSSGGGGSSGTTHSTGGSGTGTTSIGGSGRGSGTTTIG